MPNVNSTAADGLDIAIVDDFSNKPIPRLEVGVEEDVGCIASHGLDGETNQD